MLTHKSFVMNYNAKSKVKTKRIPKTKSVVIEPKKENAIEPKKEDSVEIKTIVAHYDGNEPISLSLPQSLSMESVQERDYYETYDEIEDAIGTSKSHSYDDHIPSFSDANAYFLAEQQAVDKGKITPGISAKEQVAKSAPDEANETSAETETVADPNKTDIGKKGENTVSSEPETLEDKKFEEDLKAIIEGKKVYDKDKKEPLETIKNRNKGVGEKKTKEDPEEKMKNEHAIFDKIAQSMEMATSYDLGSIAMDKKFDALEEETNQDFSKKIQNLLKEDKKEAEVIEQVKDKKEETGTTEDENRAEVSADEEKKVAHDQAPPNVVKKEAAADKILNKEFQKDIDKINELETEAKAKETSSTDKLSKQSSFSSTISIKHRFLQSRVFDVTSGRVQLMIDSHWIPAGCSRISNLSVTLVKSIDYWPDSQHGTKSFAIGGPDTKTWSGLVSGKYYLQFWFTADTNPHCELSGNINVTT